MAVRASVRSTPADISARVETWSGLLQSSSDTGAPVSVADAAEIMVMLVSGTLGAGGAVTWQGSLDGALWFPLSSRIGTPVAIVSSALLAPVMVQERPLFVRPNVTGGDGTTTLVAAVVVKRNAF